jgi:superfamily II DNA or RNA helicase
VGDFVGENKNFSLKQKLIYTEYQKVSKMDIIITKLKDIKRFEEILPHTISLLKKEKGDLFEIITFYLFKFSPQLNHNIKNIWLYSRVPDNIKKELFLPQNDKGIDLVIQMDDMSYRAVQCKFRQDSSKIVNWNELGTFFGLSFGMDNKIQQGYLVTNTYDMCPEVIASKKVLVICGAYLDQNLPDMFFAKVYEDYCLKKPAITYTKKEPAEHQTTCIDRCVEYFSSDNNTSDSDDSSNTLIDHDSMRGYVEMACGSGKTLTSYWIDKAMNNRLTVILVPSLYLLSQTFSDWVNQSVSEKIEIKYLLVGSDVDDEAYELNKDLDLVTDPSKISHQMYAHMFNRKLVIISTYQSAYKLIQATRKIITIDFAIFDEGHKTCGQINKKFASLLTDDKIIINKRLFMTATPKIYLGSDDDVLSMDDDKYYGKMIYRYSTGQAINDKKLVDYQLLTVCVNNKEIEKIVKTNNLVKYKDDFADEEANYLAIILICLKKIQSGECNHMVTYHNTINRANKFKDMIEVINKIVYGTQISVGSFDGNTRMSKRKRIIKAFVESKSAILCTARVLNEGVNIPVIDSICFVDPRYSTIDIVQCIGRSLRLCVNKKKANIIIPIIGNDTDNFNDNVWSNMINLLRAMKSTDDRIIEYFITQNNIKLTNKVCSKRELIKFSKFGTEFMSNEIMLKDWEKSIETKIWEHTDPFSKRLNDITTHIQKHDIESLASDQTKFLTIVSRNYKKRLDVMKDENNRKMWESFVIKHKAFLVPCDGPETRRIPIKTIKISDDDKLNKFLLKCLDNDEMSIADTLTYMYKDALCYVDGVWYHFNGYVWQTCQNICDALTEFFTMYEKVKDHIDEMEDIEYCERHALITKMIKIKNKLLDKKKNMNIIDILKFKLTRNIGFDTDHRLLAFDNGVYDFVKMEFRNRHQNDLIMASCGYDFREEYSDKQNILNILAMIFPDNNAIDFFLSYVAFAMCGKNDSQLLLILKSADPRYRDLLRFILLSTFGDYYFEVEKLKLIIGEKNRTPKEISYLKPIRFLVTQSSDPITCGQISRLINLKRIVHRNDNKMIEEFGIQFCTLCVCEEEPVIDENIVDNTIVMEMNDSKYKNLKFDSNDFFLLLLEQLEKHKNNDFMLAKDQMDVMSHEEKICCEFINECIQKSDGREKCVDVYNRFSDWANKKGYGVLGKKILFAELKNKIEYKKSFKIGDTYTSVFTDITLL